MKKLYLVFVALAAIPLDATAQVPRFERAPALPLQELHSLKSSVRRAAIAKLDGKRHSTVRKELVNLLLQDPAISVRQAAATALAKHGKAARKMLAYAAICDPDPATRKGLASFARWGKGLRCHEYTHPKGLRPTLPRTVRGLLTFMTHPLSDTRLRALRSLVARKEAKSAHKMLWAMATKDPYWEIRVDAYRVIAPEYRKKMKPLLRYTLTSDPDRRVRLAALEVLAYLKLPGTAAMAAKSALIEPSPKLQKAAITALRKLGDRMAAQRLATLALTHTAESGRLAAIEALLALPHRKYAQSVLARVLSQDRSGKVRAAALRALSTGRSTSVCSARAQRINDPNPDVRRTVVKQLDGCPSNVARPALISASEDKDNAVRRAALTILTKNYKNNDVKAALLAALQRDTDATNRRIVFDALVKLPSKARASILADTALRDTSAELREAAVEALSKLPGRKAIPSLAEVLARDADAKLRLAAARALGAYSDESAYRALRTAATNDASEQVRAAAAKSASKSPAQRAWVNAMLARTVKSDPATRLQAATQLCALRVPRTYRALVRLLWHDADPSVRTAVANGFGDIDSPLVDVALSVAHAIEQDGGVVKAIELAQRKRIERLNAVLKQSLDGSPEQRLTAIKSMLPGPNRKVRQRLELMLAKDTDAGVRRAAAIKLYRFADQRALQKLMTASQNEPNPKNRHYILGLYDDLRRRWTSAKSTSNLAGLLNQLQTGSRRGRIAAAKTLAVLRDRRAFQHLKAAARSTDPALRYSAILALASFGDVAILSKAARSETDKAMRDRLIQVNFLRTSKKQQLMAALSSSDTAEVMRGIETAAIRNVRQAIPYLARVALSHLDKAVRRAAARVLVVYDSPLAYWTVRVGSSHDASKKLRRTMWGLAVMADAGGNS